VKIAGSDQVANLIALIDDSSGTTGGTTRREERWLGILLRRFEGRDRTLMGDLVKRLSWTWNTLREGTFAEGKTCSC